MRDFEHPVAGGGIYVGCGHQVFDERNFNEVARPCLGVESAIF